MGVGTEFHRESGRDPVSRFPGHGPRLAILAYDGLCTFEFGVAVELFALPRPELDVPWFRSRTVAVDDGPLRAVGGLTVSVDGDGHGGEPGGLEDLDEMDIIVIPGWRGAESPVPQALTDALVRAHRGGTVILTICSGVFVLAATGLLDNRRATTHWRHTDTLAAMYPLIDVRPDVLWVDNGNLLTSAGSSAGIDCGIHLIRRIYGPEVANSVARRLVMAPQREGGQAQYIPTPSSPPDSPLAPVIEWVHANLDAELSVETLAARAHMSTRTFARRFAEQTGTTPHRWVIHQRVLAAQHLLETTDLSVEEIARNCGFGAAVTLRHHFRRRLGVTPTAFRRQFSRREALAV